MPRKITYVPGTTKKLYQLTGECDREKNEFTINKTESRFGLIGTDLGSSFEHNGRTYFLFGDTAPNRPDLIQRPPCGDSIAYTEDNDPETGLHLQFITPADDPNNYLSPGIQFHRSDIKLGCFEVPAAGFSANNKMYVFFTTDYCKNTNCDNVMGRSVLASLDDPIRIDQFNYCYDLSDVNDGGKFINLSTVTVNNANISGLPDKVGQGLLLWGSGLYRRSNVYLAYLPLDGVEIKNNLRYFAGIQAGSRLPKWSTQESDAVALFNHPEIGELSVTWNQFLRVWLILYNTDHPVGINFRIAENPWGTWSPASLIFEPTIDGGYCHFIHVGWDDRICDFVYDGLSPGRGVSDYGGAYGPYVISRYSRGSGNQSTIYFVMSTWNPYNTVLMKSCLSQEPGEIRTQLTGNPVLIQSRYGTRHNFEVVSPQISGGLVHYFRNNDHIDLPWGMPMYIAGGQLDALSLIQSTLQTLADPLRDLEVVARMNDRLVLFWRTAQAPLIWHGPYPLVIDNANGRPCFRGEVTGIAGNPVLVQSKFGQIGNFELVVPRADGGFDHFFRDNDHPALPWIQAPSVGVGQGHIDAISLIQSNFGTPGRNLEVIARMGDQLVHFWRDSGATLQWHGPFLIMISGVPISGVTGNPALIQSSFGSGKGNFELVIARVDTGFNHYFRNNDDTALPWIQAPSVGVGQGHIDAISLIQSNFGTPGRNLEVIARMGDQLVHFWRDSGATLQWHGPFNFTSE